MKTVQVRVAVIVGADGQWTALGWNGEDDDGMLGTAWDSYMGGEPTSVFYLTAELPVPTPTDVHASVDGNGEDA